MDKIKNKYFTFFATGLFIGGIFGIVLMSILVSYRMDNYIREIKDLNSVIEENNMELEKIQKFNNTKVLVKKIKVEVVFAKENEKNDITKINLEKNVKEKYNSVLGKEVEKVDVDMLCEIIDNRIMKIDDKEYKLTVKKAIISTTVKIYIEARRINN
ncbi:hypothetical protein [Clostridium massiliodielmoense]|uniref:hypothetical protein n=1 Tax=Clostridium massiliodielmoense TaxID=1776385 RepID=UPI000166774A|nr:hypothetical protein [Clostridium massiliodielmoense]EDS77629.1 conserved hypothetical protein [Clostridium botulinum C str. Eklund]KEH94591.1 hypothetical protein Z962_09335 [Clostridium botulinum C/D str. BKT12695]